MLSRLLLLFAALPRDHQVEAGLGFAAEMIFRWHFSGFTENF
jgi:hypothetical protein